MLAGWRGRQPAAATRPARHRPPRDAGRVQVAQAYTLLRSILNTAHREGLIPANPCTPRGRLGPARERVPATPDEVAAIAGAHARAPAAAVHVAAWSGLRAGELFGLARAHVNLTAGTLRVERALIQLTGEPLSFGPPKTDVSLRTVHLPAVVPALLVEHMRTHTRPGPDALVFARNGSPLDSATPHRLFRAACAAVGRPDLRWHDLRHTGATKAAQAGATLRELQARLGHSTVAAAMTYQHATAERDRELALRMADLVAPEGTARLRAVR